MELKVLISIVILLYLMSTVIVLRKVIQEAENFESEKEVSMHLIFFFLGLFSFIPIVNSITAYKIWKHNKEKEI
jgi:hypothetical protein